MSRHTPSTDFTDLHYRTLTEVATLLRQGQISSVDLTRTILARIDALDPTLKSYATMMVEQALATAEQADAEIAAGRYRGPLHGVPIAVKDLCFTRGVATMGGTAVLADHVPSFNATVVDRLEAAGAVLLGKLNLTEGAMGRYHPALDIPLNPWNIGVSAGSSSSGSAVAVAAGLAYATLGSDTGGSIRFPSAACGIVGLKPTWGRVSRYGVLPLAESLDHVGPMTRSTADAAIMLQAIAGHDPQDPTSLHAAVPDLLSTIDGGVKGLRLGYDQAYIERNSEPELADAVTDGVRVLESLGAEIVDVLMPDLDEFTPAWITLCSAEAVNAHGTTYPSRRDEYGPGFRDWLDMGAAVTGADYARANNLRAACSGLLSEVMEDIDVLVCPSTIEAPGSVTPELLYGARPTFDPAPLRFTVPFDFNGAPTLSVPCGFTEGNLPLSIQFIGHHLDEALLCRIGHAYERATTWHLRHPPL